MKSKIIGYIVHCSEGTYYLSKGILWFGSATSVFSTRRQAKRAIEKTKTFAAAQGYSWPRIYQTEVSKLIRVS